MKNPTKAQAKRFTELLKVSNECGCSFEEDNYGQLVIYTGLSYGENNQLKVMTEKDFN